jgi:diguanylate cyclase (GGDEF)-like protein
MRRKDGSEFWSHMLARGVIAGDPSGGTIWIMEDITEARASREKLSWTATHDSLTQLVNRREFESRLSQAMTQFTDANLCVLFIDLDRFKAINDGSGHAAGDEVLRQISRLMEDQVRASDTVSRLGGDEFAVLLPGCTLERAQHIAEQIRAAVNGWRLTQKDQILSVGASVGVTSVTADFADMSDVLNAADSACYEAKHSGRNCVVTFGSHGSAGRQGLVHE